MKKKGFVLGWQNKRWFNIRSAYSSGQGDPWISPGGNGPLPEFFTFQIRGRGYDSDGYEIERVFVSSAMKANDASIFRFCAIVRKSGDGASGYFILARCTQNGALRDRSGANDSIWQAEIGTNDTKYESFLLFSQQLPSGTWSVSDTITPYLKSTSYNMMTSSQALTIYNRCISENFPNRIETETFTIKSKGNIFSEFPIDFSTPTTDADEIVSRAKSLNSFKYWYGGDGRIATKALADSLKESYPSIWTSSYYDKAMADIGKRVGDCSYLVNYAYGIASPGNHGPGTSQYQSRWPRWAGQPKNGMILWRSGHTGIYSDGKSIELVGIDYDYQENIYKPGSWSAILYDPNRTY